jgi:ubiquinone/menaquinone biosynthesis C-methylase UbiE
MKSIPGIGLTDVQKVYSGPEGRLWKLVMGEQIHVGGMTSSMDLAERAGIRPGTTGVDLCCCLGAGMRFLVRMRNVARMIGVDATPHAVDEGKRLCAEEGLGDKIAFILRDVLASGLPDNSADFVWGEDAWCYVTDKVKLVSEAARIVKPGGVIAFTDWIEGPSGLSWDEAERFLRFMKFPNIQGIHAYESTLKKAACSVVLAEDTGRFAPYVDLYLRMLNQQLTYDALKIIGFDMPLMQSLAGEMQFMQALAHDGKIAQGIFVARKGA